MEPKPLILLVDDVDFFLEIEKTYLESTYADLVTARNGQEALNLVATRRPDLIYLDVNMPVMGGVECCQRLKQDLKTRDIPIVIVYAMTRDFDDEKIRACGCDDILHKPIDRHEFLNLGRKHLPQVDRRLLRKPCKTPVEMSLNGSTLQGEAIDISGTGMYVHTPEHVPVGSRFRIRFSLPDNPMAMVECWAEVAWVNTGFSRQKIEIPQGFGVTFKLMGKQQQSVIDHYLA